jgi:putative ABC transport system permease protein
MAFVPIKYPLRSIAVRWSPVLFSAFGIACTVGVLTAILALREGFVSLFKDTVPADLLIYLRPGATSEGESVIRRETAEIIKKERPEIARDADGSPLAAAETFLALFLEKVEGGFTNVPLRGVEPASIKLAGTELRLIEGRLFNFGANEVIVGQPSSERMKNCRIGEELLVNTTPFKVVGVFEHDGPYRSEVWGDVERLMQALDRPFFQRVIARTLPSIDVENVAAEVEKDKRVSAKLMTLRAYLAGQKSMLGGTLLVLGVILGTIMGVAAILGATTTMLASVGSRTREVGMLIAIGFGRFPIFLAFLFESLLIGFVGGLLGCAAVLPFDGLETGTTNFQTFTESAFAFRITPAILTTSLLIAVALGVFGGCIPAWRASRLAATVALRRH